MQEQFRTKNEENEHNDYILWMLIAVELFMSFSFLGYIHIEPISVTFVYIPVLVAGCILGPKESMAVGAVFGLASMWKASAFYVGAGDAVFSPIQSGNPVGSILLSVGARTLFGLATGLLYRLAKKGRHPLPWMILVTSFGRYIHSFFVYLVMEVCFPESGFTVADTFRGVLEWETFFSLLTVNAVVLACWFFRRSAYARRLFYRIHTVDEVNTTLPHYRRRLTVMLFLVLLASFSVAMYFTNRIRTVMTEYGLNLEEKASYDVMHLQIQFLFGMIALALIVIILIIMHQKNFNYLYYEARMDGLTGLLGRQQFFQMGEKLLADAEKTPPGTGRCFFILDVDEFKKINDVYGHPAGDRVLEEVARHMKEIFEGKGILGRLGGDEFVALISNPLSKSDIETRLTRLKDGIRSIRIGEEQATCSIGVIPAEPGYTIEELYKYADRLLYEAKKKGKDQFVFGYRFEEKC